MLRSFGGDVQGRHHAGVRLPCSEYRARRRCEPVTRSPCESLASARKLPTGVYRVCTGCGFHASPSHARSASRGALHSGREVGWRVMRDDGEEPFEQRVAGSIPARLIRFSAPDAERRRAGECTAAAGDGPRVPPHRHRPRRRSRHRPHPLHRRRHPARALVAGGLRHPPWSATSAAAAVCSPSSSGLGILRPRPP